MADDASAYAVPPAIKNPSREKVAVEPFVVCIISPWLFGALIVKLVITVFTEPSISYALTFPAPKKVQISEENDVVVLKIWIAAAELDPRSNVQLLTAPDGVVPKKVTT